VPDPRDLPSIPKTVSQRLSQYLRVLQDLQRAGEETVSSRSLAARLELTAAQVRKDLTYFGQFGLPGVGYRVVGLIGEVRRILGTDRTWSVALIGAGNLGSALARYQGFAEQGFAVRAIFDCSVALVGRDLAGHSIRHMDEFEATVTDEGLDFVVLAVPIEVAQDVCDLVVGAGIRGILNFAPLRLQVPTGVHLIAVDLAIQLEQLSFLASSEGLDGERRI